jgi:hypothetical protein
MINYNGRTDNIQLDVYGRNALFVNNLIVTIDSTLTNDYSDILLIYK